MPGLRFFVTTMGPNIRKIGAEDAMLHAPAVQHRTLAGLLVVCVVSAEKAVLQRLWGGSGGTRAAVGLAVSDPVAQSLLLVDGGTQQGARTRGWVTTRSPR